MRVWRFPTNQKLKSLWGFLRVIRVRRFTTNQNLKTLWGFLRAMRVWRSPPMFRLWGLVGSFPTNQKLKTLWVFFLRAIRVWRSPPMFHLWGFGAFPPIFPTNVQIKSWKLCDVFWELWEFGAFPPIKNWKLCEFFCLRAMRVWRSTPMFHLWGFGAFPPILPTNVQIKSGKLLRVMRVWGLIWELP